MQNEKKIRILIVDDHQLVVDGLKAIFNSDDSFTIVGIANNGKEALNHLETIPTDLVLTDIDMPEMNGIDLVKTIQKNNLACKVIVMTMHNEKPLVKEVLGLGAHGFLLKTASSEEMVLAVKSVMGGNNYVSSEITQIILQQDQPKTQKKQTDLSKREIEILQLIAEGFSNKQIGEKIFISHRTVDKHRANMMQKIGAKNVAEMVSYAIRNELID